MPSSERSPAGEESAGPSLILDDFIPYRVVALGHAISRNLAHAYESEDLAIPEWRVLAVVSQADCVAARDVVRRTPMDKMAVSRAVASLEKRGLVVRKTDARDRRVYSLSLSAQGRVLFRRIARLATAYEKRILSGFSEDEQRTLRALLSRLEASARQ